MTAALCPVTIETVTGLKLSGFERQFTPKDRAWKRMKYLYCDVTDKDMGFFHEVTKFTLHPDAQRIVDEAIRNNPAPNNPRNNTGPDGALRGKVYMADWTKFSDNAWDQCFARHLCSRLGILFTEAELEAASLYAVNQMADELGIGHFPIADEFTNAELDRMALTPDWIHTIRKILPLRPNMVPCYAYAFLCAKYKYALEGVIRFLDMEPQVGGVLAVAVPLLARLTKDFEPVKTLQSGDLVLYLKNGVPEHMAFCNQDGRLLSKYGFMKHCYVHDLASTGAECGNQVIIWRRKTNQSKAT